MFASSLRRLATSSRPLASASRSPVLSSFHGRCYERRSFSVTRTRLADIPTLTEEQIKKLRESGLVEKVQSNPEFMRCLEKLQQVMQTSGCDIPPTKIQLMKLSFNDEFRTAIYELQVEMQKAGIDQSELANLLK
ncbi:hypothetical protein C8J56DRAFT_935025 [Mycena floridula]|nr:hypothetical protein C8J56DRAFT_935025 [Mycena floridula]